MAKPIEMTVTKWRAFDGQLFDNQQQASDYELTLQGLKRQCPTCLGTGLDPANKEDACPGCSGKGYQERAEVWQ